MQPPARAGFAAQVRNAGSCRENSQQILKAKPAVFVTSPAFTNADYPLLEAWVRFPRPQKRVGGTPVTIRFARMLLGSVAIAALATASPVLAQDTDPDPTPVEDPNPDPAAAEDPDPVIDPVVDVDPDAWAPIDGTEAPATPLRHHQPVLRHAQSVLRHINPFYGDIGAF